LDSIKDSLSAKGGGLVAIALHHELPPLGRILSELNHELVDVRTIPSCYHYARIRGAAVDGFGTLPIISLAESPARGWRGALKRILDVALAVPLLVLGAPVMALTALAIRVSSPGPALFHQRRIGQDGRTFQLIKFRTMASDAERNTGPVWAKNQDPRCTRVGRFLRRTSLDELPQLWNVVRGDMTLVGPRPERPVFVEQFARDLPMYMLRHSVKGGMTGWAQINGWRGDTSVETRLEHDLYYIENWNPLFDLKILFRTLTGGFLNRNA
jgi:exopolysaccharide biosynthesis polyprenyl glycosylphosphotransferase